MINRRKTKCGLDSGDYCYSNLDSSAFEEGSLRPIKKMSRYLKPGAAGEVGT